MMHGAAEMHGSHGNIMDGYPESMRSGMHVRNCLFCLSNFSGGFSFEMML